MKRLVLPLVLLAVLALSACAPSMTINSDFDHSQDFTKYKTFRYATKDELNPDDILQTEPFVGNRVKAAIEKNLQASGYQMLDSGETDFVVLAHAGVQQQVAVSTTTSYGYGGYGSYYGGWYDPWWGPYGGYTSVSYYNEGTLVIDIVDTVKKELTWRGMATATLADNPSAQQQEKNITKAVNAILINFPPTTQPTSNTEATPKS